MTVIGLATTHERELLTEADWVVGSFGEIGLSDMLPPWTSPSPPESAT